MTREELEARVAELEHLNHRLANQIAGYGDRMQLVIGGVVKEAKVAALREAADEVGAWGPACIPAAQALRTRADNLEKS